MQTSHIGRWLLVAALVTGLTGLVLLLLGRLGVGRLPGDFSFGSGNVRVFVPLATSILLSIVATIILNLIRR